MASNTKQHDHHLPALLRLPEVRKLTGLGTTQIYRLARRGEFPQPVKITERSSAWIESEVRGWIASRIATRDTLSQRAG